MALDIVYGMMAIELVFGKKSLKIENHISSQFIFCRIF
jgi:hypothetical protein